MTKNKESTRYYSKNQENEVAAIIGGFTTSNSGANKFNKGDIINKGASLLCECKTCVTEKDSFSIKKEWLEKNKLEAFENRLDNCCLAFNFGPETHNYFIINEKLMKYLVDTLENDNEEEQF